MEKIRRLMSEVMLHHKQIIKFDQNRSDEINKKINLFIDGLNQKRDNSHDYYKQERAASKPNKDNHIGKIGEYILSDFLVKEFGFPADMAPDLTIYDKKNKGWSPDLPYSIAYPDYPNVHCKACDQQTHDLVKRFRPKEFCSWTFQKGNSTNGYGRDELLKRLDSRDVVGLVYVRSVDPISGIVVATAPWHMISDLLDEPVLYKYKHIKTCLYPRAIKERALQTN